MISAAGGGENEREVVWRLRVVGDPNNAREVERTAQQIAKTQENGAKAAAKAVEDSTAAQKRAIESARKAHEQAAATMAAENKRAAESFKGVLDATMMTAQGLAMMGLAGEENTEKLLRGLIKLQAGFNIVKGGIDLVIKGKEAWQAYAASVSAANAAQMAMAGRGAATGLAAGAAGAGGAAAGGAAGGMLLTAVSTLGAAMASLPATIAAAIVGVVGAGAMITNVGGVRDKTAGKMEGWISPYGYGPDWSESEERQGARRSRRAVERMTTAQQQAREMAAVAEQNASRALARQAAMASVEQLFGNNMTAGQAFMRASAAGARADQDHAAFMSGQGTFAEAEASAQKYVQLLQQAVQLREAEKQAVKATNEAAVAGLKQQSDMHYKMAEQIRSQRQGIVERFGAMDPMQQARVRAAAQKARAGGDLTREEAGLLQSFRGVETIDQAVRGSLERRAQQAGIGDILGGELNREANRLERRAAREDVASQRIEARLKDERGLKVTVERDDEGLITSVVETFVPLLQRRDEQLKRQLKDALARAMDLRDAQQGNLDLQRQANGRGGAG